VKPNATDVPPRANKRAKMEGYVVIPSDFWRCWMYDIRATVATQVDDRLTSITLVSEVLSTIPLPASLELVSTLLETLSVVTQLASVAEGEAAYAQQLLMNAVEAAASPVLVSVSVYMSLPSTEPVMQRLPRRTERRAEPFGWISSWSSYEVKSLIDVVSKFLWQPESASSNPQTFHQALLLIAHVAPLARESIIHNLMPIFTFMGSNIFHRDDVYSFRVVQKVRLLAFFVVSINRLFLDYREYRTRHDIVTERIQQGATSPLDQCKAVPARLLRRCQSCTSPSAHAVCRSDQWSRKQLTVRLSFFSHLVEVLGADEFLAPMCMLLVDKVANRATKQTLDDAQATMNLPLMLMQKLDVARQVTAMHAILHEAKTHLGNITGTNHVTFLGDIR
jgi:U3 small nucleolar RNA-associated protein 10